MKVVLISFHKNLGRYPKKWIDDYKDSILSQTYKDFDIFELNYGLGEERIFDNSYFESLNLQDHAQAHNYLLQKCFSLGYELILNSNIDDKYPLDRIKLQVEIFDPEISVISGNYTSFSDERDIIHTTNFDKLFISKEFSSNHNIIAHPACGYTRKILDYNEELRSEEIASDDFCMWKRLLSKGAKFKILPNVLLYYRISELKTKA